MSHPQITAADPSHRQLCCTPACSLRACSFRLYLLRRLALDQACQGSRGQIHQGLHFQRIGCRGELAQAPGVHPDVALIEGFALLQCTSVCRLCLAGSLRDPDLTPTSAGLPACGSSTQTSKRAHTVGCAGVRRRGPSAPCQSGPQRGGTGSSPAAGPARLWWPPAQVRSVSSCFSWPGKHLFASCWHLLRHGDGQRCSAALVVRHLAVDPGGQHGHLQQRRSEAGTRRDSQSAAGCRSRTSPLMACMLGWPSCSGSSTNTASGSSLEVKWRPACAFSSAPTGPPSFRWPLWRRSQARRPAQSGQAGIRWDGVMRAAVSGRELLLLSLARCWLV